MATKKNNGLKVILILLPVLAGAGIIAWAYKKQKKSGTIIPPGTSPQTPGNSNSNNPASCTFPLKKGSVNNCVRQLQLALMAKYGISILPKYGADGNWGSETQTAVETATGQSQVNTAADLNIILNNLNNVQGAAGAELMGDTWWMQ